MPSHLSFAVADETQTNIGDDMPRLPLRPQTNGGFAWDFYRGVTAARPLHRLSQRLDEAQANEAPEALLGCQVSASPCLMAKRTA